MWQQVYVVAIQIITGRSFQTDQSNKELTVNKCWIWNHYPHAVQNIITLNHDSLQGYI